MASTKNGLTPQNYELLKQQLGYRESNNNYGITGGAGGNYLGKYQTGAQALETQGYLEKGAFAREGNRAVWNPANWTGKDGATSATAYLNNPGAQENAFYGNTVTNYNTLKKIGVLKADASQEDIAGSLSASHLIGAGGLKKQGLNGADAFGTKAGDYYGQAKNAVATGKFEPTAKVPKGKPPAPGASAAESKKPSATGELYKPKESLDNTGVGNTVDLDSESTSDELGEVQLGRLTNVLERYASFNALWTLSSLSRNQVNFPENTYLQGSEKGIIIFSSGGREPFNRVETAYKTSMNKTGQYDFFIDNVEIELLAGPQMDTKGTNGLEVLFDVFEPYSMGMFLQALQIAAYENGYTDYKTAPYLLTLEFMGYNSNGDVEIAPNSTRYFPIQLSDIEMEVAASGSKYKVKTMAWSEGALMDSYNVLKQNTAISGETVQEMLQSGDRSLQYVINSRFQEMAQESKEKYLPDEVVIVFPTITKEPPAPDSEEDGGATTGPGVQKSNGAVISKLTLTRTGSLLTQSEGSVSPLGLAKMGFDMSRGGQFPKVEDNVVVIDGTGGVVNRSLVKTTPTQREFTFSQGTTIVNAITEVMLMSDYCTEAVQNGPDTATGMYDWFKIETQVYLLDPEPGNEGNNRPPKLLVYKVLPYKVHMSRFQAPTQKPVGYDKMKEQVAKEYNYIYTGKNVDILDFHINLKSSMFIASYADSGKYNGEASQENRFGAGGSSANAAPTAINNTSSGTSGDAAVGNKSIAPAADMYKNSDGSAANSFKTLIAKQFQEQLLSDNVSEMLAIDLTIMGDPYFISDSGAGNYSNGGKGNRNYVTPTGAIDYQQGEVDILINFRTPVDLGADGLMEFPQSEIDVPFSGLYTVQTLKANFNKGKFTQVLSATRRLNQDPQIASEETSNASGDSASQDNDKEYTAGATAKPNDSGAQVVPDSKPGKVEPPAVSKPNSALNTATDLGTQVT